MPTFYRILDSRHVCLNVNKFRSVGSFQSFAGFIMSRSNLSEDAIFKFESENFVLKDDAGVAKIIFHVSFVDGSKCK